MERVFQKLVPKTQWADDETDPIIQAILLNRGVSSMQKMSHSIENFAHPNMFSLLDNAVDIVMEAVIKKERIYIAGDYDADGATACTLMVDFLKRVDAQVDFVVPNRFVHGYGLSPALIDQMDAPSLIITVDNGISAHEACDYARSKGIKVVITDHHLPGESLPIADAIVNPSHPDEKFPYKELSGVGVAWYVLVKLREKLNDTGYFNNLVKPNMAEYLDLVALGTVADCVPLTQLNRSLVCEGLKRINLHPRPGISALINAAKRQVGSIIATDLGFALGPRLNAAGRLDDMRTGILLLLEQDPHNCRVMAESLSDLNRKRQDIEKEALEGVHKQVELSADAAVVYDPNWHEGVIGLIASRVKERYQVPTVAMTNDQEEGIKGSARSIAGINIKDELTAINASYPGMILKFGGHAMAAGLTIERRQFDKFKTAFVERVGKQKRENEIKGDLYYDFDLPDHYLTLQFAQTLQTLSPWGAGMPEPIFCGNFIIHSVRQFKRRFCQVTFQVNKQMIKAIGTMPENVTWSEGDQCKVHFSLGVNYYLNRETLNLVIKSLDVTSVDEMALSD
tara:strand:+ start:1146 stop:2846 length:1701 start_codon:yes stop_codon:yes gene_type:complete